MESNFGLGWDPVSMLQITSFKKGCKRGNSVNVARMSFRYETKDNPKNTSDNNLQQHFK